jgi:hypothetical protein
VLGQIGQIKQKRTAFLQTGFVTPHLPIGSGRKAAPGYPFPVSLRSPCIQQNAHWLQYGLCRTHDESTCMFPLHYPRRQYATTIAEGNVEREKLLLAIGAEGISEL